MERIAVVFPGMGYGKDKPLLYYAARQAKELGYEIVCTDYDDMPPMAGTDIEAKTAWTEAAYLMAAEQLAGIDWEDKEIVFIAKSVGTIIASKYAADHGLHPVMILLTPLDETFAFLIDSGNYIYTGEADPYIDLDSHDFELDERIDECVVFEDANHSLECGDVDENIEILREVIGLIKCVLTGEE